MATLVQMSHFYNDHVTPGLRSKFENSKLDFSVNTGWKSL